MGTPGEAARIITRLREAARTGSLFEGPARSFVNVLLILRRPVGPASLRRRRGVRFWGWG